MQGGSVHALDAYAARNVGNQIRQKWGTKNRNEGTLGY
jgi:hypothetical protein